MSDDFFTECLNAHNEYRAKHGCPPLTLNSEISKFSKSWAEKLLSQQKMQHSGNSSYGENLYYMFSSDSKATLSPSVPVKSWYDEIKFFKFGQEPKDLKAGHFTQVIWKDTKEVGIGLASNKGYFYVVADYAPPGNVMGNFKEMVPPPK